MRKYKHKITGDVVTQFCENYYVESDEHLIFKRFVENSNDWEEVKYDYKTISWIDKKGNVYENEEPVGAILGDGEFHITSVTRESDSESFSLGDVVTLDNRLYKITKFKEIPEESTVVVDAISLKAGRSFHNYRLDRIERANAIFTTEDGVDIFIGNEFYYIGDAGNICLTKCLYKGDGDFSKFKTFAEKQNAEKFISDNKKMYTLKDVTKAVHNWSMIKVDECYIKEFLSK